MAEVVCGTALVADTGTGAPGVSSRRRRSSITRTASSSVTSLISTSGAGGAREASQGFTWGGSDFLPGLKAVFRN